MINSLSLTVKFFVKIFFELAVLFIAISFVIKLLQELIPPATVNRILTGRKAKGNIIGAALGSVTPFCSCSTIPIMVGLFNSGAPFGPTMSFLIASPLLNPMILVLLMSFFGWKAMTIYAACNFLLAVVLGGVWDKIGLKHHVRPVIKLSEPGRCCPAEDGTAAPVAGSGGCCCGQDGADDLSSNKYVRALGGALQLFKSVLPYLVFGTAAGALIYGFVPTEWVSRVAGPRNPLALPVAALVGIPLYIRAETMIPVGMVLMQKGMSPGSVIALIIGGAGASLPELTLLAGIFKPRLLAAFIFTVFLVAVTTGFLFNLIL